MNGQLWVRTADGRHLVNLAHCEDIALHAETVSAYQENFSHRDGARSYCLYDGDEEGASIYFEALMKRIGTTVIPPYLLKSANEPLSLPGEFFAVHCEID